MTQDAVTMTATGVLFDMDGTLVDSTAVVEAVWAEFAARYGLDLAALLASSHGRQSEDTVRRFAPPGVDVLAEAAWVEAEEVERLDGIVQVEGAGAALAALPPDRVALVTSASEPLATARMAAAQLPMPAVTVTAESVDRGKPHPEGYLLAASRLGLEPDDVIVFEDAEAGIAASLAAGMRTIVVGDFDGEIARGCLRIPDFTVLGVDVEAGDDGPARIRLTLPAYAPARA